MPARRRQIPASTSAGHPVYVAKNAYIDKHKLVVFRLSDHWKLRRPEPFAAGLAAALGWTSPWRPATPRATRFPRPRSNARRRRQKRLAARRDSRRRRSEDEVRSAGLLPGSTPMPAALDLLPGVDVVVAGEVREWESVEYARDVVFSGQRKGLILVGRVVSEEPGMTRARTG